VVAAVLTFLVVPGAAADAPLAAGDLALDTFFAGDGTEQLDLWGTAVDRTGAVYVVDRFHHQVLRLTRDPATGGVSRSVVAGTGSAGPAVEGPATASPLNYPIGVAVGPDDSVYIADRENHRVERVTPDGVLRFVAGTGTAGLPSAGPATSSRLNHPTGVAVDGDGDVYIADQDNNRLERVDPAGALTVLAGTSASGAPAVGRGTTSRLFGPAGVAVDSLGNVYIADNQAQRVAKLDRAGVLSLVAGSGGTGAPVPGPATRSPMPYPFGVAVDGSGDVFVISDAVAGLMRIDPAGQLAVVVGSAARGAASGPASRSSLRGPRTLAIGPDGAFYIGDTASNRVQEARPAVVPEVVAPDLAAAVGVPFRVRLSAAGFPVPTLSVDGTLPPGLAFDPATGVLSGTPTTAGPSTFAVVATNAVGTDRAPVDVEVSASPPGAPQAVQAVAGNGRVDVSWGPPATDGGSAVEQYVVDVVCGGSPAATVRLPADATSATVSALRNGVPCTATVRAVNSAGAGDSATSAEVLPVAPPPVVPAPTTSTPPVTPAPVAPPTTAPPTTAPVTAPPTAEVTTAPAPRTVPAATDAPVPVLPVVPVPVVPAPVVGVPVRTAAPGPAVPLAASERAASTVSSSAARARGGVAVGPPPAPVPATPASTVAPTTAPTSPATPSPSSRAAAGAPVPAGDGGGPRWPGAAARSLGHAVDAVAQAADAGVQGAAQALAIARTAVVRNPQFPASLGAFAAVFLVVQSRVDRRDPKLALATLHAEPDVPFPDAGPAGWWR